MVRRAAEQLAVNIAVDEVDELVGVCLIETVLAQGQYGALVDLLQLLLSEALPLGFVDQVAHFGQFCDGEENLEVFGPAFDLFLEALNLGLSFGALGD